MEKAAQGAWEGYIIGTVASEVVYVYLRLALGVTRYELRRLVARRDERVRALLEEDVKPLLSLFEMLPLEVGVEELMELVEDYGLLPNDALIVVAALRNGVDAIATFDRDFKKVPWVKIIPEPE